VPQDTSDFFVDIAADSLDTATTSETPDCRLGDALDVFPHHLPMPLGTTLSETFATFAATRHGNEVISRNGFSPQFPRHNHSKMAPWFVPFYSSIFAYAFISPPFQICSE
jgi:hypothetical protein